MAKYNANSQLKVDGKMNAHDAGTVGKMQATAWIILASGGLVTAIGFLLLVLKR